MGKRLGGDTGGTADPNWPNGYSVLCVVCAEIKTEVEEEERAFFASSVSFFWRLVGHWSACGMW